MPYRVANDRDRLNEVGRPESLGQDRIDGPLEALFESEEDPKGWDRASIKLNTHPLHPFPDVAPTDLLLPSAANKLRLVVDCIAVGVALALLSYFPLLLFAFTRTDDITSWILGTMLTVGCAGAVFLFFVALADEREFRREFQTSQ